MSVFDAVAGVANAAMAYSQNEKNIAFQQRENDLTRLREDSAYQRAVGDARSAGLSPLAVVGTAGSSSQALTAPQVGSNPVQAGLESFSALRQSNSQVAYNNALTAKTVEDTKGQSISNANLQAEYNANILKLLEESSKINVESAREREFLREYRERLTAELRGSLLQNEGKALNNAITISSKAFNEKLGFNPALSWSASASSPIGFGLNMGKSLSEQSEIKKNNALADKTNKENLFKEYVKEYRSMFDSMMSDWQSSYNSVKDSLKGDSHGYFKLKEWLKNNPKPVYHAPKKSDFGL